MEAVALPAGEELKEWYAQSSWGGEGPPPLPMTGEEWGAHPGGRALPPSSSQPPCADLPIGEELKEWCAQAVWGKFRTPEPAAPHISCDALHSPGPPTILWTLLPH